MKQYSSSTQIHPMETLRFYKNYELASISLILQATVQNTIQESKQQTFVATLAASEPDEHIRVTSKGKLACHLHSKRVVYDPGWKDYMFLEHLDEPGEYATYRIVGFSDPVFRKNG